MPISWLRPNVVRIYLCNLCLWPSPFAFICLYVSMSLCLSEVILWLQLCFWDWPWWQKEPSNRLAQNSCFPWQFFFSQQTFALWTHGFWHWFGSSYFMNGHNHPIAEVTTFHDYALICDWEWVLSFPLIFSILSLFCSGCSPTVCAAGFPP